MCAGSHFTIVDMRCVRSHTGISCSMVLPAFMPSAALVNSSALPPPRPGAVMVILDVVADGTVFQCRLCSFLECACSLAATMTCASMIRF